eukprot:TRINITY_DN76446_c0_g1_i1.p1 TRINITY_DN76446_c0_g1~~TRINITY_DN76446_c0_g1_i1.p1  ORF type:complete len:165 (+),score=52.20 TRINITY_DN76446_c0_g1_i1:66-560(+)
MARVVGAFVSVALLTGTAPIVADEVLSDEAVDADDDEIFKKMFKAADTNDDGELSHSEAVAMARAKDPDLAERQDFLDDLNADFRHFDTDRSGKMSPSEFVQMMRITEKSLEEEDHDEGHEADGEDDESDEDHIDERDRDEEAESDAEEQDAAEDTKNDAEYSA